MKIAILVEGETEKAFEGKLRDFLWTRLEEKQMPKLKLLPQGGRIPTKDKLKRKVDILLSGKDAYQAVIALTDVYTGTKDFKDAEDAKAKMRQWVGNNPDFYPHVALHDFEAWLLPYWKTIQELAKHNLSSPSSSPETVNHNNPPAHRIKDIFERGQCKKSYSKPIHGKKILEKNDLNIAIQSCPELKAFINTILSLSGGTILD
ncbi:MAG: DUF4276 family protein [Cyanobacteria bacterium P01_E01_bin.42]